MKAYTAKTEEKKSPSLARPASRLTSSQESTRAFVDNRPEAFAQQRLSNTANQSPRVQQLAGFQQLADQHQLAEQRDNAPQVTSFSAGKTPPLQLRTFKEKEGPLGKKKRVEIVESGTRFDAFLKTGISKLTPLPKCYLKSGEFEKYDRYPFLQGHPRQLMNLGWITADVPGVGSLLMHDFVKKAKKANKDLFIPTATMHGPAYYESLGFKMVGDWVQQPHRREELSTKVQESLGRLEENTIEHDRTHTLSNSNDNPSQGMAEMFGDSDEVLKNVRERVDRHWKITKG